VCVVIGEDANNNLSSPNNDAEAKCRAPPRAHLASGAEHRRPRSAEARDRRRRRRPNRDPDRGTA